jgi:hypothetical protein
MKNNKQKTSEQKFLNERKSKDKTIHLEHAPDPRGRDGLQIDPDND